LPTVREFAGIPLPACSNHEIAAFPLPRVVDMLLLLLLLLLLLSFPVRWQLDVRHFCCTSLAFLLHFPCIL